MMSQEGASGSGTMMGSGSMMGSSVRFVRPVIRSSGPKPNEMRWEYTGIFAAKVSGVAAVTALAVWPIGQPPEEFILTGDGQRGAYLARASGCIACHTNFEQGGASLAGGSPLETYFGTFYPPNLTADPEDGIGARSIPDSDKAVRQGISPDGQPYCPTFTYPIYANLTDEEFANLWAAFQTVPAVSEPTPAHEMPIPFNQRWG